jgi:hypothetical protein
MPPGHIDPVAAGAHPDRTEIALVKPVIRSHVEDGGELQMCV